MIEIYLAAQTDASIKSLSMYLELNNLKDRESLFETKTSNLIQDMLLSASITPRTSQLLFDYVLKIFSDGQKISVMDIKEKSALTIGSLAYLMQIYGNIDINSKKLEDSLNLLIKQQEISKSDESKLIYFESLKNSQHHSILERLYNINFKINSTKIALSALKYLHKVEKLPQIWLRKLIEIFQNKESPEELRIEALELIFEKFNTEVVQNDSPILENIFYDLSDEDSESSYEFDAFCIRLILNYMKNDPSFR